MAASVSLTNSTKELIGL